MSTRTAQSQATARPTWTSLQAYLLAVFCLLLGVALGYLFRGSASPETEASANSTPSEPPSANFHQQPQASEKQAMLAQVTAPLLEAVKKDPNDFGSLVKLGNIYYDGQQFPDAVQYYERALAIHPENADVRTDMGTAYWYEGNADKAVAELEKSLKYRPGYAQALFNLGVVRWQGKTDPKGAVQAWEELLKANPAYPQRQQVEQYIQKAKEHATRG